MQRAVHRNQLAFDHRFDREAGEKVEVILRELPSCPLGRTGRSLAKVLSGDPPAYREIVVSRDADAISLPDAINAFGGVAIVADDIAEADDAIY
jgi:hypothetical protein